MTLEELLGAARDILDDHVEPYLFSDAQLTRHFNDAVAEACIRTRVLQDSSSAVTTITLVVDQATYTLDPSIFAVRRARVDGQRDPLDLVDVSQLDSHYPGWDDPTMSSAGTPVCGMFDAHTGKVTLVPRPAVAGTLRLLVWRSPVEYELLDSTDPSAEPVLPQHMHRELKHWAAAQALMNQDAEQHNPQLAGAQLGLFEQAYGRKPTLHEIRLWSTNKRSRVRASFD